MQRPQDFADEWASTRKEALTPLMEAHVDLRRELIRQLLVNPDTGTLKRGIPELIAVTGAEHDRHYFDLIAELLTSGVRQLPMTEALRARICSGDLQRPPNKRGRPYQSGGRDFVIMVLVAALQAKFPYLHLGANESSFSAQPAAEIARKALEKAGFEVLDGRKLPTELEDPEHRSVEKALRRLVDGDKIPEFHWP